MTDRNMTGSVGSTPRDSGVCGGGSASVLTVGYDSNEELYTVYGNTPGDLVGESIYTNVYFSNSFLPNPPSRELVGLVLSFSAGCDPPDGGEITASIMVNDCSTSFAIHDSGTKVLNGSQTDDAQSFTLGNPNNLDGWTIPTTYKDNMNNLSGVLSNGLSVKFDAAASGQQYSSSELYIGAAPSIGIYWREYDIMYGTTPVTGVSYGTISINSGKVGVTGIITTG